MVALAPVPFECWSETRAELCPRYFCLDRIAGAAVDPLRDVYLLVILRIVFFLMDTALSDEQVVVAAVVVKPIAAADPELAQ